MREYKVISLSPKHVGYHLGALYLMDIQAATWADAVEIAHNGRKVPCEYIVVGEEIDGHETAYKYTMVEQKHYRAMLVDGQLDS